MGIGAVLSQVKIVVESVIAYGSHILSTGEQRYCVTRRELLAMVYFVQQHSPSLYGTDVVVCMHHVVLEYSLRVDQPPGQFSRWFEILQENIFRVVHRRRVGHCNADALFRLPLNRRCACLSGASQ